MHIPSHQIQNVLKAYQKIIIRKQCTGSGENNCESVIFSGDRHAKVEKITRDIATRIIESGITRALNAPRPAGDNQVPDNTFIFNTIVAEEGKVTRTFTLDSADFLINSLERLPRDECSEASSQKNER